MNNSNFPRMHVSLYVSNISETINFYSSFFGKPANKVKPSYAKYVLNSPSLIISFIENPSRVNPSFGHLGIQVETLEEMHQRLALAEQQEIVSKKEIGTSCCYAVQDKFWVNDPDGHQWEIYYFHTDAEFNDPKYEQMEESNCCISEPAKENVKIEIKDSKQVSTENYTPGSGCC